MLLPFYVRKERFDLWVESFTPPFSTSCLQLFTKKPVIGLVHMLSSEDMERKYKLPFHLIEDQGLKSYKYFIVLSDAFKKKIQKVNQTAKIFLIPNGVEIPTGTQAKDGEFILYIGRLEVDQKGIDLLIDSYATIAKQIYTKLVIAGSGSLQDTQRIKHMIHKYKLEEKISLVGRVDGKEKDKLLQNASVVVIPSRFETFGIVALEAMAYGKPLVSFAIEGFQWIPKECILKVKPFDTKRLGHAINKVLQDKKLREKMSLASRQEIKQFSWEKIGKEYTNVFTTILN
jgi:glycosyltransferase involved in cell wall biosynthesis